jgi:putative ABC transport system permease protein
VAQRTHVITVRMARSPQSDDVLSLVIRREMLPVIVCLIVEIGTGRALMRVFSEVLYGVSARVLLTFVEAPVFLLLVAFPACYIPVRVAMRIYPLTAPRTE